MPPFGLGGRDREQDKRDFDLGSYQPPVAIPARFVQDVSVIPVKFQGTYGTCGAHAGAFFDSKLQTDKRGTAADLSPKYLWKEIKQIDGYPLDAGTDLRSIMKSLAATGDCDETTMPNTLEGSIEEYSNPRTITLGAAAQGKQNDIGAYAFSNAPSMDDMKQAIYQNKAVIALVRIGNGWWTAQDGHDSYDTKDILPLRLGTPVGAHFVVLFGYDENFIYFRNSWGMGWGEDGNGFFGQSYVSSVKELGTALVLPAPYLFTGNLAYGQTSNDVKQLQKRLGMSQQTGYFGFLTLAAVLKYQYTHALPTTGFVGAMTRTALNTSTV